MSSIQDILTLSIPLLKNSQSSLLDIEVLLCHILKKDKAFLYTHPEYKLNQSQYQLFKKFLKRRKKHEPIAYILKKKEFFGRDFYINKNVLIPRPLTEILCEIALEEKSATYLDIGTGSGCIIITLAKKIPSGIYYATDISQKALYIARKNAGIHNVKNIIFYHADLLPKKNILKNAKNITIVANLPYLSPVMYKTLSPSIRKYEPKEALVASQNGLFFYKKLLERISTQRSFNPIVMFFEILSEQKNDLIIMVKKIFPRATITFPHTCIAKIII